jgi:hypothetical protein
MRLKAFQRAVDVRVSSVDETYHGSSPFLLTIFVSKNPVIDHNLYEL